MNNNTSKFIKSAVFFIFILLFSFVILYICTASSPRYAINPWVDSNAFFTVGKGMANGIIPYKDLFEQKGPLLYLIHAIAYMISNTSFTGVYILESISLSITLFFFFKTASLVLNNGFALTVSLVSGITIINSFCFFLGDSAEEFCLPSLAMGMYYIVLYFNSKEQQNIKWYVFLLCGISAGCVVMIKYSLIGFWLGWMAMVSLYSLFKEKKIKEAFVNAFIFLGGMIIAFIPFIIYFLSNDALSDFINTYFIINTKFYSANSSGLFSPKMIILRVLWDAFYSRIFAAGCFFAVILSVLSKDLFPRRDISKFTVPVLFVTTACLVYAGMNMAYYFLAFAVFVPFCFIVPLNFIEKRISSSKIKRITTSFVLPLLLIIALPLSNAINISSKSVHRKKEDTIQYKISEYINAHKPNADLLNYGSLDGGFLLFDNKMPSFKYFEQQNIEKEAFSMVYDEQDRYIKEKLSDYVVIRNGSNNVEDLYNSIPYLRENYELVFFDEDSVINVNRDYAKFNYYLFEVK